MQFVDHNTDHSRLTTPMRPFLLGLLENTQIYDEDSDPRQLTKAIKYRRRQQDRRDPEPYEGDDPFLVAIKEIFGFPPLDFQLDSWNLIRDLDDKRKQAGEPHAGVFSAPTGFGKTEAFLGALYQLLRTDEQESVALVYPRTALLQDQLGRILEHLHGMDADLSVGVYMGDQPWTIDELPDKPKFVGHEGGDLRFRLTNCWCGGDDEEHSFYVDAGPEAYRITCENNPDHQFTHRDLILSKKNIAHGDNHPDILLTTLESLELFSLKPNYSVIDKIDTVVLDEAHMYTGLRGAHAAQIIENINDITDDPLLWLGSSATIDNPSRFSKKLFGLPPGRISAIEPPDSDFKDDHEDYEHFYFVITNEDGPTISAMMIQQLMLVGHSVLGGDSAERTKALSFIDSKSQINQKYEQLQDAEQEKQLWQLHRDGAGYENWDRVAADMPGAAPDSFYEQNLTFQRVSADHGFDAATATDSDVLLSTSFLEVGIDVGDLSVVSQYRTPRQLSSFIQRSGRAGRTPDMQSHILVFLSNLTGDANMFYRADRFLDSELRTPLKRNNAVVEWVHGALRAFYYTSQAIDRRKHRTRVDEEAWFFDELLADELGFEPFAAFLTDPAAVLGDRFDTEIESASLQALEPFTAFQEGLETELSRLESEYDDIEEYVSIDGGTIDVDEAPLTYVAGVEDTILAFIQACTDALEDLEPHLPASKSTADLETQLTTHRDTLRDASAESFETRVETCRSTLDELLGAVGRLRTVARAADPPGDTTIEPPGVDQLTELERAVDQFDALDDRSALRDNFNSRQEIYHLQSVVEELEDYFQFQDNGERWNARPYESADAAKSLLRAAYYFDRFLSVRGDGYDTEVWYYPPNYFDSSGRYITVCTPSGTIEKSIESLVHTYAPLRSEYKGEGELQLFLPRTVVTEGGDVVFDFENDDDITGEVENGIRIPDRIALSSVTDRSTDAKDIVGYCPECYQILERGTCVRHGDISFGKIHADAQVQTTLLDHEVDDEYDRTTLTDVTAQVTLQGATLEITPARGINNFEEFIFTGAPKIHDEIHSPETPIGFTLNTRGLLFDISDFLAEIATDDVRDTVAQYKNLDSLSVEELGYHTAAHFFLQLVADISGVDTSMLFYGMDHDEERIYVFERTEGGQGLTDLVFDEAEIDPGNVLESLNRIGYNTQVLNERLWATDSFVGDLRDVDLTESAIQEVVEAHVGDEAPFRQIHEQLTQEVLSTADRANQLADEEPDLSAADSYEIKHTIATAQVAGESDFPRAAVSALETGLSDASRAKSRFYSPDIDGCVENLHVSECISGHDQEDVLSYVLLEQLREVLIDRVPRADAGTELFDRTAIPAGEVDDESIFLRF